MPLAQKNWQPYPNVDGVVAFVHGTGCGMAGSGDGFDALQRVMWGYAQHPNHAGVLMVGLGCEMNQIDWLLEAFGLKNGPLFQAMNIQDVAGLRKTVEIGIEKVRAMLPEANKFRREPCPAVRTDGCAAMRRFGCLVRYYRQSGAWLCL